MGVQRDTWACMRVCLCKPSHYFLLDNKPTIFFDPVLFSVLLLPVLPAGETLVSFDCAYQRPLSSWNRSSSGCL